MMKLNLLVFLSYVVLMACGQNNSSNKELATGRTNPGDTITDNQSVIDTSRIAILPVDTGYYWLFKSAKALTLSIQDLENIDRLLADCIIANNSKKDSTKRHTETLDLKEYKRQYVPFIDSTGEKKVYVNCFCAGFGSDFIDWKKNLVMVDDGGNCFFQVTINLSKNTYEQLYINGYA